MRPVLFVLAGVNGAGKSTLLSRALTQRGLTWFDPDAFARELVNAGAAQRDANGRAWQQGMALLEAAIAGGHNHAHETTLGGRSMPAKIAEAALTHDVHVWYCGLDSPERHLERVRARVEAGGHDIDEQRIRERWESAPRNLIALMPVLRELRVYDNSQSVRMGEPIPVPCLLLQVRDQAVLRPDAEDLAALQALPTWSRPIVEAALARAAG